MTINISLQPEVEARFQAEAVQNGLTLEQLASQRLLEAELLWRIRTASPESEKRRIHLLLRKQRDGLLAAHEQAELQAILDDREMRGAERLNDLVVLASLRAMSVRQLMEQLGIHPLAAC